MSDYLWDKEGAPDPEIAELEQLLAPLAYRAPPPRPPRRRAPALWLAASALAVSALVALLVLRPRPPGVTPAPAGFDIHVRGGTATLGGGRAVTGDLRLPVGAWIDSGSSEIEIVVAALGTVRLAPGTSARIAQIDPAQDRLELARGSLRARIAAPPRRFAVQTPYARATDLGCEFSIAIDGQGVGKLAVIAGAVALSSGSSVEVRVGAGSECAIDADGPGAPYAADASSAFRAALLRWRHDPSALTALLREARIADLGTLRALPLSADQRKQVERRATELDGGPTPAPTEKHVPAKATPAKHPPKTPGPTRGHRVTSPLKTTAPAAPPKPDGRLRHDALQDLERSSQ